MSHVREKGRQDGMLGPDEQELVWESLEWPDRIAVRGVCRVWREGIDRRLGEECTLEICVLFEILEIFRHFF